MRTPVLMLFLFWFVPAVAGPQANIISVTHRLKMKNTEKETPRDFFVDMGAQTGIRAGDTLTVYREFPVLNAVSAQVNHLMRFEIGELRVIAAGQTSSLARLQNLISPDDLPAMGSTQPSVGDAVELKNNNLPFRR